MAWLGALKAESGEAILGLPLADVGKFGDPAAALLSLTAEWATGTVPEG